MVTNSTANSVATAELVQELTHGLADGVGSALSQTTKAASTHAVAPLPQGDVAAVLLSEVATSDLTKLTKILEPASNPDESKVLDTILRKAVEEVSNGNIERAIGYLADYATRDPRRAEALPAEPELALVRDKINSLVNRMTQVARMSAEDGLSRAELTATQVEGKLSNWDTDADVLLKLAHRLYDAGGYANYSRTAELAKLVAEGAEPKPAAQALAASAAAAAMPLNPTMNQPMPGLNVPYWVSSDIPVALPNGSKLPKATLGRSVQLPEDIKRNLDDLQDIAVTALAQLWFRAPLLVIFLTWFSLGLVGGTFFAVATHIIHSPILIGLGDVAFGCWALVLLGLVGFGFYARVRYRPSR